MYCNQAAATGHKFAPLKITLKLSPLNKITNLTFPPFIKPLRLPLETDSITNLKKNVTKKIINIYSKTEEEEKKREKHAATRLSDG